MGKMDVTGICKCGFEATIDIWRKAAETSSKSIWITSKRLGMMEEAQAKLQTGRSTIYTNHLIFSATGITPLVETLVEGFVEQYIGS